MKKVLFPILAVVLALSLALPMAVSVLAADEVYPNKVHDSWQGTQKGGGTIGGDRSDPNDALGAIDKEFFSLGFKSNGQGGFEEEGGWIILEFDDYVGTSITIVEQSPGTGYGYPLEEANVYVSADAASWTLLGTANNQIAGGDATGQSHQNVFDLEECIKFVKIVDVTDPTLHTSRGDAFDLDSVWAGPCEEEPLITNLCAAQDIEVGTVTVDNDDTTLTVTYEITDLDWIITETHLYVGQNVPFTSAPGQFPYDDGDAVYTDGTMVTYTIALADITSYSPKLTKKGKPTGVMVASGDDPGVSPTDPVYIAAHAVVFDTTSCQGSVVAIKRGTGGDVYEIDMGDGSPTLLGTITAGLPPSNSGSDLNSNNGYAFDYVKGRLYFAANTEGNLYFFDVGAGTTHLAGALLGAPSNASYYQGAYYYINQDTDDLHIVTLDATSGAKVSETVTAGISGANNRSYNFGDIAITPDGFVYAASKYSGEGHYYKYFTFDLSDPAGTYTEVAQYEVQRPQIALGGNGEIYGVATGDGQFYSIDKTTGALTPTFNPGIQFNDLASGWLCEPVIETAWGGACDGEHYATFPYPDPIEGEPDFDDFVYFFNPPPGQGDGGNWASFFVYEIK